VDGAPGRGAGRLTVRERFRMRQSYSRALPRAWQKTAQIFTALGDSHRQRIVLMFEDDERLSVGQIVAASPLSRSAVAHHLRVMREAGVLQCEKVGKEVWYWPEPDAVRAALGAVHEYLDDAFPARRAVPRTRRRR
jgi:DNA-binding transcriptional ArsR family regulator